MSKGSVIKRINKDGSESWVIKYDANKPHPQTGGRWQRYKIFRGKKKDAEIELHRILTEQAQGQAIDPSKLTLSQWSEEWLKYLSVEGNRGASTLEGYETLLRVHVLPVLGAIKIQDLTVGHFKHLYHDLLKHGYKGSVKKGSVKESRGLSHQSVRHIHRVTYQLLKAAKLEKHIRHNVLEDLPAPNSDKVKSRANRDQNGARDINGKKSKVKFFTRAECVELLKLFKGHALYPFVFLSLSTGLRKGETLALHWSAVNFEDKTLTVECGIERTAALGVRVKNSAKNESSERTIPLDDATMEILRNHKIEQAELAMKLGKGRLGDCLVFPHVFKESRNIKGRPKSDADFKRPYDPSQVTKTFVRIAAKGGLKGRNVHSLRHSHATHLLEDGVPPHVVSARLGHSSTVITLEVYAHVSACGADLAAESSSKIMQEILLA